MTPAEAVDFYLNKKQENALSTSEIRKEIIKKQHFSDEEVKTIMRSITNRELENVSKQPSVLANIESHLFVSYFFVLFSLAVIVTSIYFIQSETQEGIAKLLPWVMILGALFIGFRHASRILRRYKPKQ